jgi:hypothetical protein
MGRKKRSVSNNKPAASLGRSGRRPTRRRGSSRWSNRLIWITSGLIVVAVLVGLNLWDSGVFAEPRPVSRSEDLSTLLPLAEPQAALTGTHDMELIPQETPAPQPAPSGAPLAQLDMPSASYDFGRISDKRDVAHIFAVQNVGSADLVASNLVTSCGCTVADLSSSVIPPGQRADLTVTFDPDFHEVRGAVTRLVWFATNDPTQPWVEVRITASVQS